MNTTSKTKISLAIACAVITFIVFLPTLQNDFILWDDGGYFYDNSFIRSFDMRLLKSAFMEFHLGNWHPVTWLSHAFDYALWGLNPLGPHLTNNLIHALNTFILALLIMRLLEVYRQTGKNNAGSQPVLNDTAVILAGVTAGLLFGIHPLRVESVAWVSERKDLLCSFFYLLTIAAYTRYVGDMSANTSTRVSARIFSRKYFLTIALFILALMSKPMAVSLPLVLLILDWYLYKRIRSLETFRTVFLEKMPFIILSFSVALLTLFAQASVNTVSSLEQVPLASRFTLAAGALAFYLIKTVAPAHLVPLYPIPQEVSIFSFQYLSALLLVVLITAACIVAMRRQKLWMAVWAYYVITLAPVLGIVKVGDAAMADRYTYLPGLGFFLIAGLSAVKVHEKISSVNQWGGAVRLSSYVIAVTIIAFLSYATIRQIGIWKDSVTFWTYVIDEFPGRLPLAHNNLGVAYAEQHRYDEAINEFKAALQIDAGYADAYYNIGAEFMRQGSYDDAITEFKTALAIEPDNSKIFNGLRMAHAQRDLNGVATGEYTSASQLERADAAARNDLGSAYMLRQRYPEAVNEFKAALAFRADFLEAHFNLGNVYAAIGLLNQAIAEYRAVIALDSDEPDAHYNLGNAYASLGSMDQAIVEYRASIALRPDEPDAHKQLSDVYLKQNRLSEAARESEIARELIPRGN